MFSSEICVWGGVSLVLRGLMCLACPCTCLVYVLVGLLGKYVVVSLCRMMLGELTAWANEVFLMFIYFLLAFKVDVCGHRRDTHGLAYCCVDFFLQTMHCFLLACRIGSI